MNGLVLGHDDLVSAWAFKTHNINPIKVDRAVGVLSSEGVLVGAILFSSFNGMNANLGYYGKGTLSAGIVRSIAMIALYELHLVRLTVIVPQRPKYLHKRLFKLGFACEGTQRRFYGDADCPRNTGVRYVMFREALEKLASVPSRKAA